MQLLKLWSSVVIQVEAAGVANSLATGLWALQIDGVDYAADLNGTAGPAGIVAALNGNTAFANLFTASVVNAHDVQIAAGNAGTDYALAMPIFAPERYRRRCWCNLAKFFMGGNCCH